MMTTYQLRSLDDPARMLREHAHALSTLLTSDKYPPGAAAHSAIDTAVSAMTAAASEIDLAPLGCTVDDKLPLPSYEAIEAKRAAKDAKREHGK